MSTSRGPLWILDADGIQLPDPGPISLRFLIQDDCIAIADGLQAGQPIKDISGRDLMIIAPVNVLAVGSPSGSRPRAPRNGA